MSGMAQRVRQAAITLLLAAVGARFAWSLLAPVVPILVSLVVMATLIWVVLGGGTRGS